MSPSTLPYLPEGQEDLPAGRFVIFADSSNRIQKFDESLLTYDGEAAFFESFWESCTLNKEGIGLDQKLNEVRLLYFCQANVTGTIGFSADGGETWTDMEFDFKATTGLRLRSASFDPKVQGEDLRFRINLPDAVLLNIVGFDFRVRRGGRHALSQIEE